MIGQDPDYRIGSAAMWLARDLAAVQVLTAGEPVARSRLHANRLLAIGEPIKGEPFALDDRLALRCEGVRLEEVAELERRKGERTTAVLDDVAAFVRRFIVLNAAQAHTLALWCAHTHGAAAFDCTPYLAITSAEKRSGKTRLLEVIELIVHQALPTANTSDAALFRSISAFTPTLLLDEVDAVFKSKEREDLRGLLNAGYRRGAKVRRMGGPRNTTLETFDVYCPKAFAGIGNCLPDTILDRSIRISLQRKTRDEHVERFRRRDVLPFGETLRDRLAAWIEPQVDELRRLRPELPEELDDRAQDIWEPLLAIAALAGGEWPARAWDAALELSGNGAREDDSLSALLLHDIHRVFTDGAKRLRTADLIAQLSEIEESPWGDWYGKPISPQGLSKLLKPHGIKTMPVWIDGEAGRGYKVEQFADAFSRVLGVRGVRSVRSKSPSQAEPNAPNAPNADHARTPVAIGENAVERERPESRFCEVCTTPAICAADGDCRALRESRE